MAFTSSEIICKAMEVIPGFKEKSYQALHHWFKRFREKYFYSKLKITKKNQILPKNFLESIKSYLSIAIKDMKEKNIEFNSSLLGCVMETPLVLESHIEIKFEKIGETWVKIKTFGKSKLKISFILCIFANGKKAPPMIVFKGLDDEFLEKRLNKIKEVYNNKVFVICQKNTWVDPNTFTKWLKTIWFRKYSFRNIEGSIIVS